MIAPLTPFKYWHLLVNTNNYIMR